MAYGEHFTFPGTCPVHSDALAAELVGELIDPADVFNSGFLGEVHSLAHRIVGKLLEGRLHADMPFGAGFVGGDEHFAQLLRNGFNAAYIARFGHFSDQFRRVEPLLFENMFELGIDLNQLVVVQDVAGEGQGKNWFNTAGTSGNNRNSTGWCNGSYSCVAHRPAALGEDAAFVVGEGSPLFSEFRGGVVALGLDEAHDLTAELDPFIAVVRDAKAHQQICKAHHAKADLAVSIGHFPNGRNGVIVDVDHIVQKADADLHHFLQAVPVDCPLIPFFYCHLGQVDGAEVAALIREQRLLAAGIGRFDFAYLGSWVGTVDAVKEDDSRFSVFPGHFHNQLKDFLGVELAHDFFRAGIDQIVLLAGEGRLHKLFSQPHRYVEVGDLVGICLALDKVQDIGVVYPQNPHIGAAAGSPLLDGVGGGVIGLHKGHRSAGHAPCGAHHIGTGPQARKAEACSSAGFLNQSGVFEGIENSFHGVLNRKNKTSG